MDESLEREEFAIEVSRRQFLQRAGAMGAGALVVAAMPTAARMLLPDQAAAQGPALPDATLQAFFDTIIPGRAATVTDLGNPIHPDAIAGVDSEPGAVEADALLLAHHPKVGFDALEAPFLAELEGLALPRGGNFLSLAHADRNAVCVQGLSFDNPSRVVWEAAAAIPFTAFCAAATQIDATDATAGGYRVMGHPGTAPNGYSDSSFDRVLAAERTANGYLP